MSKGRSSTSQEGTARPAPSQFHPPKQLTPGILVITLNKQNNQGMKINLLLPSIARVNRNVSLSRAGVTPAPLQASESCPGRLNSNPVCWALSRTAEIPPRTGWRILPGKEQRGHSLSQPLFPSRRGSDTPFPFPFSQHSAAAPSAAASHQRPHPSLQRGRSLAVPKVWVAWAPARNAVRR